MKPAGKLGPYEIVAPIAAGGMGEVYRARDTRLDQLLLVKRAFSLAVQAGKVAVKPHVPMLKENNVRAGFFERDQFEAVRPGPGRQRARRPGYPAGFLTTSGVQPSATWYVPRSPSAWR